jgi:ADP-dependent NAD(P)H-hydrate dehydratase / NAD(P)H-hydrate epimerase
MSSPLLLAGTVPSTDVDLVTGAAQIDGGLLVVGSKGFPLSRGTAAMIGAACAAASYLEDAPPGCVLGGDVGRNNGSRSVYRYLIRSFPKLSCRVLGLHYIVPDIALHNQMAAAIRKSASRPTLIADAGFMYVAKASGQARFYDLFLPDVGELAFLADEKALHPAYTRGFLTSLESDPLQLAGRAFAAENAPAWLCVKGRTDYVCHEGAAHARIDEPVVDVLEAIGGTGDTITGMTAALVAHGLSIPDACRMACRANRIAGLRAAATPATQIQDIIARIPEALRELGAGAQPAGDSRSRTTQ